MPKQQLPEFITLTTKPPTSEGFYWYYDRGEHTPTVLQVELSDDQFWASDAEFCFKVERRPVRGAYWGRVPYPMLNGKPLLMRES